ncbi:MAG: type IV pilus assembly protein PilM [Clostridia bacterium]|nr:type IV pilus assembly protein PilM [Clostridia bacterium]
MIRLPFFNNNNTLVSIDIGFRNIKVVEVRVEKNKEIFIKNFGIASTPRDCIKNGAIKDVPRVTKEIKKVIIDNHIKAKNAKIVMSGTNIISRIFMVDMVPGESLDNLINQTVAQNMPINTEEHRIDYKILQEFNEGNSTKLKIFVTAVSKNIIKSYIDILLQLGLKPISVDIPANSTAKFFNREIKVNESESWYKKQKYGKLNQDAYAVLDFGSETTIVNILKDRVLEFNKVILIGSSNLEVAITKVIDKKLDECERLKKMYGMVLPETNVSEDQEKIYHTIKDIIDKVLKQIHQCFDFYEKRCYGSKVGKIYVIGGGSLLKGLREYLEESLEIPVYPVGLLSIDGVKIHDELDKEKLNFLINSVGITL